MRDVADMQDDIGGLNLFQGRAERGHQMGRQVGDEAHRIGQDHLAAGRQFDRPHGRIERREQQVLGESLGSAQPVEQRGLAGVGVADQRHHRIGHAGARLAVEATGAAHLLQFLLQLDDPSVDQTAVDFQLAFTGTADEAEAAALPLQVGPRPHKARALVAEGRQFDLKLAFTGPGAVAEDFQDQAGTVDHLGFQGSVPGCVAAPATGHGR